MPTLTDAQPQLFVSDIPASCAYLRDRLGFAVAFMVGEPPYFAQVARDGVRLNLRHVDAPVMDPALAAREDLLAAMIRVDGVEALFQECQTAGADFHQALRTEPWGDRTFVVRDPDGNLLCFAGS